MVELVKADALYKQLANVIRDGIATGRWQPGDMLPSEAALKTEYGVSATTVRQALIALRAEGLIIVRNGIGSFVSSSYNQPAATIDRTGIAEAPALTPTGEAMQFRGTADPSLAALLDIAENEPLFIVEVRATEEGTGRRVLIRRMIPIEATDGYAPDPDADTATLLAMLTKRHGKPTTTEYVRARMPNPDERSALDLSDAVPIFETIRVATAKRRTIYAETQRTSTEGVQLAYPIR
jgi:GntR family transcriptional regulator